MEKLKVLIAEKDILIRKSLADAVNGTDFGRVVHVCASETIALDWLEQGEIDILLLDVHFLKLGGLNILKKLSARYPKLRIVITVTRDPRDTDLSMEALKLGAVDILLKPALAGSAVGMEGIRGFLQALFAQMMVTRVSQEAVPETAYSPLQMAEKFTGVTPVKPKQSPPSGFDLLLIASSTGGPRALESVLTELPAGFSKPVLAVQHMPADFTRVLAQALDKKCNIRVQEAESGDIVQPGHVYIAPGGVHMVLRPSGSQLAVELDKSPLVNGVRPSADVLFRSVAQTCQGKKILAVILTGMGNDGTRGLMEIKQKCDCYCITQNEGSCIVYGMPKSVYEAGLSDEVADLSEIANRIVQIGTGGG